MKRESYAERSNRDARARELKAQGYRVHKSSIRNQYLHPMYLVDRRAELSASDKGFGNTLYRTLFVAIYDVEWEGDAGEYTLAMRNREQGYASLLCSTLLMTVIALAFVLLPLLHHAEKMVGGM